MSVNENEELPPNQIPVNPEEVTWPFDLNAALPTDCKYQAGITRELDRMEYRMVDMFQSMFDDEYFRNDRRALMALLDAAKPEAETAKQALADLLALSKAELPWPVYANVIEGYDEHGPVYAVLVFYNVT